MAANFSLKELCGFDASMQEENMSKKFAFMQAIMCIPVNIPGTAFHTYLKVPTYIVIRSEMLSI